MRYKEAMRLDVIGQKIPSKVTKSTHGEDCKLPSSSVGVLLLRSCNKPGRRVTEISGIPNFFRRI